ncbi:tachykinin-3 isoform X2 [Lepidochelys kempii]|uniref:tachykinin-3 isoform X2 n=1 Tax=Lepidochelys kempii TaxID=8472 RepID=UPI003C6ED85C
MGSRGGGWEPPLTPHSRQRPDAAKILEVSGPGSSAAAWQGQRGAGKTPGGAQGHRCQGWQEPGRGGNRGPWCRPLSLELALRARLAPRPRCVWGSRLPLSLSSPQPSSDLYKLPTALLRRLYNGHRVSYEELLQLAGKDDARTKMPIPPQKHDPTDRNKETSTGFGDLKYPPNAE